MLVLVYKPHSFVDLITNSSTELYVVDKSKTEETFKFMIDFLMDLYEIDYESSICKFTDSDKSEWWTVPEGYNADDLYLIDVSYHNNLLSELMRHFHVVYSMSE